MNFFLLSDSGAGLGLGLRLRQEGHSVVAQIRNKRYAAAYDGLLPKSDKLMISPDTIYLFDAPGGGKTAERLRGQGHLVLGGSMFADQLEGDPELGRGLMEECEIKTGSHGSGFEIATGGWFDGNQFGMPLYHRLEADRLMNDDLGPECDAGSCVWACDTPNCRIAYEGLLRLEPILRHHGYRGSLELETLVDDAGVWGLEWNTRLGGEAFPSVMEGFMADGLGEMLARYARGEPSGLFPLRPAGYAVSLRVSIPPYPSANAPAGVAVRELVRADRPHAYFYDVWLDKDGALLSSGGDGAIADFTGYGDSVFDAANAAKEIADRVQLTDKQYRTDMAGLFSARQERYRMLTMPPAIEADPAPPPAVASQ